MPTTTTYPIASAVGDTMGVVASLISFAVGNPLIMVFIAVSLLGIAISVFKKLKG